MKIIKLLGNDVDRQFWMAVLLRILFGSFLDHSRNHNLSELETTLSPKENLEDILVINKVRLEQRTRFLTIL